MAYLGNQPKDPISVSTTAPSNPKNGAVWFHSELGETFVYYEDGDSSQWVQLNPSGQQGPAGPTGPAGANGEVLRTELDAYLQVANSTSFATTSQLDNYLQVANASSLTPDQLSQYLQVANLSSLSTSLLPSANVTFDLGSQTKSWKDLYLSGNTIFLGTGQITLNANGGIDLPSGSKVGGTPIGTGSGGGASVTIANTAPSSPSAGDLWWYGTGSELYIYYDDGDSQQWVQATTPGATGPAGAAGADGSSVTSYANTTAFPSSGNSVGDFAFATNTKAVYIWDGSEWDRISTGVDESPVIVTEPPSSATLYSNGSLTTVTMVATDPEGFDITYGIAYNNAGSTLPTQLASATTVNSNGVFTFTPSSNTSHGGSFKARLSASDGAKTTTRFTTFTLTFSEDVIFYASEPGTSTTLTNTTTGWSLGSTTPGGNMMQSNTLQTGKRYFEMYVTAQSGQPHVGIYPESNTDPGHNDADGPSVNLSSGAVAPTATFTATGQDPNAGGYPYTYMIAFDTVARKAWFGLNGTWSTGSGDPTSGSIGGPV